MKKLNTKVTKRVAALILVAVAAFSVMGCSVEKTVTKTETHTDADGNTTTTTTTKTTDNNGTTTTETTETTDAETDVAEDSEYIVATIAFENETGVDIYELYFSVGSNDQWGDEILGEDAPLADGEIITCPDALTYSPETGLYWDLLAADSEGASIEFEGLDLSNAADSENITIVLEYDAENEDYTASVQ